jgi:predicted dehydrogenase
LTVRFAVIGCGRMGVRRARALRADSRVALKVVVDPDTERAKTLAAELSCVWGPTLDFRSSPVDAVVVSTPNRLHTEQILDALSSGKHVFCEKPLATKVADARQVADEAEARSLKLQVGSNIRHFGNVIHAHELIQSRRIGQLAFARGWIGHDGWVLREEPWTRTPDNVGGGTLIDNGCHLIDLMRWFVGNLDPLAAYSIHAVQELAPSQEDNFVGILRGPRGEPVTIQTSWSEWYGYLYCEFYGTEGAVYIDSRGRTSKVTIRSRSGAEEVFDYTSEGPVSFAREMSSFVSSIVQDHRPSPDGREATEVLETIGRLYDLAGEPARLLPPRS